MKSVSLGGLTVIASVVAAVASCNALWGVGDLDYRATGGAVAAGGSGGSGGGGGGGGTGGAGGTGGTGAAGGVPCDESNCDSCLASGCASECAAWQSQCEGSEACTSFMGCVLKCSAEDAACQSDCAQAFPTGVHPYYRWVSCAGCAPTSPCAEICSDACAAPCSTGDTCEACANDTCAQTACLSEIEACAGSSECLSFNDCVANCGDSACNQVCIDTHSNSAIDLYNQWSRCVICTKAVCWDDCSTVPFNCAGY